MKTKALYVIVRISDGEIAFGRAYETEGHAKSALKNRIWTREWSEYAVAKIEGTPVITARIASNGEWTQAGGEKSEVSAE